ncbi:MAG: two pore domain potassium channel family protein [Muribaculaceae bacterium]|nr:two pore domain potassium channel family protein [Muribaculaceae bacterium]MDE6322450.1 two pore domain potassium channel family protein [Muribaculaceae bacterium]
MDSSTKADKKSAAKATSKAANTTAAQVTTGSGKSVKRPYTRTERAIVTVLHTIVLVLSLLLIVFISYDTFEGIPFLENKNYMTFQLWVCIVFLIDFFAEMIISHDHWDYVKGHWFYLLISIPYLNILAACDSIILSDGMMYIVRFIPLIRGCYALTMIVGYISRNKAISILSQYVVILLTLVYILSLIFFYEEYGVNPDVKNYWDSLYFSAMNTTTVGCYFAAVTPVGKIISVILPTAGMLMLPLFTVYVIDRVKAFNAKRDSEL